MRRTLLAITVACEVLFALSLVSAQAKPAARPAAQRPRLATGPGQVTVSWTQSVTPSVTGNKVYRAPCTGTISGASQPDGAIIGTCSMAGTFSVAQTFTSPATTFTDTTVAPQTSYVYQITALVGTAESAPSGQAAVTTAPVAPPTGVTITATNEYELKGKEHISATYQDTPNVATVASLFANDSTHLRTWVPAPTGVGSYTVSWEGTPFTLGWLVVSDAFGHSTSAEF